MAGFISRFFSSSERELRKKREEDIEFVRKSVLRKFPLLGTVMVNCKIYPDDNIVSAATDGKNIYYSPKFFESLDNDEQRIFILAHEYMHIAFDHVIRSKERDKKLWNIATDAVINQMLVKEGLPISGRLNELNMVNIKEAVNYSSEEVYDKLVKQQERQQQQQGGQGQPQNNQQQQQGGQGQPQNNQQQQQGGQGQPQNNQQQQQGGQGQPQYTNSSGSREDIDNKLADIDLSDVVAPSNHGSWQKSVLKNERQKYWNFKKWKQEENKKEQNPQQEQGKKGQSENNRQSSLNEAVNDGFHDKEVDGQGDFSLNNYRRPSQQIAEKYKFHKLEKEFLEKNYCIKEAKMQEIREKLQQAKETFDLEKLGNTTSYGKVGHSDAVLNWKKVLKKALEKEEDRWSYRRSSADNDWMARVEEFEEEGKSETEVMLDVSGSVDEPLLREFLRQLKPILKHSKMKVGCFDHRAFDFKEIKTEKDIDNYRFIGGGGTDIDLAVRRFSKKKQINKIVFTDGYSYSMPRDDLKDVNVLWLIYDNNDFHPVCGKVIYVQRSNLKKKQNAIVQNYQNSGR